MKIPTAALIVIFLIISCGGSSSDSGKKPDAREPDPSIEGIELSSNSVKNGTGAAVFFDARVSGTGFFIRDLEWSVDPAEAGTVTGDGLFIADMNYSGEYTITVTAAADTDVQLTASRSLDTEMSCVCVDLRNETATENGTARYPYKTIQAAADAADSGDAIRIAAGEYPGQVNLPAGKNLFLLGGFAGGDDYAVSAGDFNTRDTAANPVEITAPGADGVVRLENISNYTLTTVVIDGVTVSGGKRGIFMTDTSGSVNITAVISNCVIESNTGFVSGDDYGGGISMQGIIPRLYGSTVRNNSCGKGGGISIDLRDPDYSGVIARSLIYGNTAYSDHGGGAYLTVYSAVVTGNEFYNNTIDYGWGWGGGLIVVGSMYDGYNDSLYVELTGNKYYSNSAPSRGGGLFIDEGANVRLCNELVHGNTAPDGGAGIYIDGERGTGRAETRIYNTTAAMNTGSAAGGGIYLDENTEVYVKNSIIYGNEGTQIFTHTGSSIAVTYSGIAETFPGKGNISSDPLFAAPENGDFHLQSSAGRWDPSLQTWVNDPNDSPCINSGDPLSPYNYEPAPNGSRVNMGAYANTPYAGR